MHQHDAQNTGQSSYLGSSVASLAWKYTTTSGGVDTSPVIGADGTIYFGSSDSYVYALNSVGTLIWKYETGNAVYATPSLGSDGTIYVGSSDGFFYALNPNGSLKWKFTTQDLGASSGMLAPGGTIYVAGSDNKIYALNSDGALQWSFSVAGQSEALALAPDGTIYATSCGGGAIPLYAINPDGSQKWVYSVVNNAGVYACPGYDPSVGSDGTIYSGGACTTYTNGVCTLSYFFALNPGGTLKWKTTIIPTGGCGCAPAISSSGILYVPSNDAKLYALSSSGALLRSFQTGGSLSASPAIGSDGSIYFGGGQVTYSLTSAGAERWAYITNGNMISSPAIGSDGTVYITSVGSNTGGGILWAMGPTRVESRSVSTSLNCQTPHKVNAPIACYVRVTDTGSGTPVTPTGTVGFSHTGPGNFGLTSCLLVSGSTGSASCRVFFTPTRTGPYTITGNYFGDQTHSSRTGSTRFLATQ